MGLVLEEYLCHLFQERIIREVHFLMLKFSLLVNLTDQLIPVGTVLQNYFVIELYWDDLVAVGKGEVLFVDIGLIGRIRR